MSEFLITELDDRIEFGLALIDDDLLDGNNGCTNAVCSGNVSCNSGCNNVQCVDGCKPS